MSSKRRPLHYIVNYVGLTIVDTETEEVYHHNFPNFSPNESSYMKTICNARTVWGRYRITPDGKIAADVEFGRGCFYQYYFFKTIVLDVANPETRNNSDLLRWQHTSR